MTVCLSQRPKRTSVFKPSRWEQLWWISHSLAIIWAIKTWLWGTNIRELLFWQLPREEKSSEQSLPVQCLGTDSCFLLKVPSVLRLFSAVHPNDVQTAGVTLISRGSRKSKQLQNHNNYLSGGRCIGYSCQVCFHLTRHEKGCRRSLRSGAPTLKCWAVTAGISTAFLIQEVSDVIWLRGHAVAHATY